MESLLQRAGITRDEFAERLGISNSTIRNWLTGRSAPNLDLDRLLVALQILDCTLEEFAIAVKTTMSQRHNRKPGRPAKDKE